MNNPWADPSRFNLRFWKTSRCMHWERGQCKRGADCSFAHGAGELRTPGTADVPEHVKEVRAAQDEEFRRQRESWREGWAWREGWGDSEVKTDSKRPRSPEADEQEAEGARGRSALLCAKVRAAPAKSHGSGCGHSGASASATPVKAEDSEDVAEAQPAQATPVKAAPAKARSSAAEPLPASSEQTFPPLLPATAKADTPAKAAPVAPARGVWAPPSTAEGQPAAAARPTQVAMPPEDPEGVPTQICALGICELRNIFLGAKEAARSSTWLEEHAVQTLVRCVHNLHGKLPAPGGLQLRELPIGLEWEDLADLNAHFAQAKDIFYTLSELQGNVLFWCRRGRHRSATAVSMYLMFLYPHERPEAIMAMLRSRRPGVEFFESSGKYPPLAKVVRAWYHWLHHGEAPRDALPPPPR